MTCRTAKFLSSLFTAQNMGNKSCRGSFQRLMKLVLGVERISGSRMYQMWSNSSRIRNGMVGSTVSCMHYLKMMDLIIIHVQSQVDQPTSGHLYLSD